MGGIAVRAHGILRPNYDVDLELAIRNDQFATFFNQAEKLGYEIAPI